jgi:hypothetical protein
VRSVFQISTRSYDDEIGLVRKAMQELEEKCGLKNGYSIGAPFAKAGWTFFNVELSVEMTAIIEKSGMMEGALGYRIAEQLKNFLGHYLESKGSNVRIKKLDE